jgi:AhpD family alkylhydroperoxidase
MFEMNKNFEKRIYTPSLFARDILYLASHLREIFGAVRSRSVSRKFAEKIMTVITAVNGCVYCQWFHAKQAISNGISKEELSDLVNLQFQSRASPEEAFALIYAQHYAETNRNPEPEMTRKLVEFYGPRTASHILVFIRLIYFGNLAGNTWDAVISRIRGDPAGNSSRIFEAFFALAAMWIMIPAMIFTKTGSI